MTQPSNPHPAPPSGPHHSAGRAPQPSAPNASTKRAAREPLARSDVGPAPAAKQHFGRYEVLRKLGQGGMGAVYEAFDPSLRRKVAVKVILERRLSDASVIERFLREARSTAALDDPHVVKIHDIGFEKQVPYIAMEFVEGQTLQSLLSREKQLPAAQALEFASQAALGLRAAWAHGIVHRDVKPANLLVTPAGCLKVTDFGLARLASEQDAGITQPGEIVGTPLYMAPEQASVETPDFRCDIYALGATLYHMLTGRPPFLGDSAVVLLASHLHGQLPPVREFAPKIPKAVAHLVERMLEKEPAKRHPSYDALLADLEAVRRPPAPPQFARPIAAAAAVGLGLGILLWIGTGLSGGGAGSNGSGPTSGTPPKRESIPSVVPSNTGTGTGATTGTSNTGPQEPQAPPTTSGDHPTAAPSGDPAGAPALDTPKPTGPAAAPLAAVPEIPPIPAGAAGPTSGPPAGPTPSPTPDAGGATAATDPGKPVEPRTDGPSSSPPVQPAGGPGHTGASTAAAAASAAASSTAGAATSDPRPPVLPPKSPPGAGPAPRSPKWKFDELFHGEVHDLGNEWVDLRYRFASADELKDWSTLPPPGPPPEDMRGAGGAAGGAWRIADGHLEGTGRGPIMLQAEFVGDVELEATVTCFGPDPQDLRLLLHAQPDLGGYAAILSRNSCTLSRAFPPPPQHPKPRFIELAGNYKLSFAVAVPHALRFARKGNRLELFVGGKPNLSVESADLERGNVGFSFRGQRVCIDEVRVHGRVTRDWLDDRR
ncbi:MAG: protein kinase [Planctomycetes bacterium]|nr:protein kinase [Planctomycetota bacterium]